MGPTGGCAWSSRRGTGEGRLGVAVTLQPKDKTLTDAEIEALAQKIVAEAEKKTGATLRG